MDNHIFVYYTYLFLTNNNLLPELTGAISDAVRISEKYRHAAYLLFSWFFPVLDMLLLTVLFPGSENDAEEEAYFARITSEYTIYQLLREVRQNYFNKEDLNN